jgi:ubiquinone biosynthesis monooxygenase Coq7
MIARRQREANCLYTEVDRLILGIDTALRAIAGVHRAVRTSPAGEIPEGELDAELRAEAAALMRVNHVGEVCAQALYQGQALTARSPGNRRALAQAAAEEEDHLAWSAGRIQELGGRLSLLNPLWYGGASAIGTASVFSRKPNARSRSISTGISRGSHPAIAGRAR